MLSCLFLLLLAPLSALALPASRWVGQFVWEIDQKPFAGDSTPPALAPPTPPAPARASALSVVYQFQDGTQLENLASRSNGYLVLSAVSTPKVYGLDPRARIPRAKLLYTFPEATSLTGIIEAAPDLFVVTTGNYSGFEGDPGSFCAWSIDFNTPSPSVKMITRLSDAGALNGMTTVEGLPDTVLIADSRNGAIWRLNTKTGDHHIVIQHVLFNSTASFPLGINGLTSLDNTLYFTNSAQAFYGRVPVDIDDDCSATAEPEIIARAGPEVFGLDDIALDWAGRGWVATHHHSLTEISVEGKQRNFTHSDLAEPTSVIFGRGSKKAERTLYVTTAGWGTAGGQVIAVDTCLI
ncbi:MAG: hypothetical protein Q9201_006666 [Fulgogasparrea decipioides]